jgi:hypothetical protein
MRAGKPIDRLGRRHSLRMQGQCFLPETYFLIFRMEHMIATAADARYVSFKAIKTNGPLNRLS